MVDFMMLDFCLGMRLHFVYLPSRPLIYTSWPMDMRGFSGRWAEETTPHAIALNILRQAFLGMVDGRVMIMWYRRVAVQLDCFIS